MALASSSNVFANAESPKYFEPLADERSNLLYSYVRSGERPARHRELARRNALFGQARETCLADASEESVFAEWPQLFSENKAP